MTEEFNTQKILDTWDINAEQQKVIFMEHMYECSGRNQPGHPCRGLYTGLWQEFCIREAGPAMRDQYFEFLAAVEAYENMKKKEN
jgi:hypothetical protein